MPSFHPPPKQSLDAWDEDFGDTTLQLSDLVAATASTNLEECLLAREDGGAQWTGTGQLQGNFFHEPVLNERRVEVVESKRRASSPVVEGKRKGRARDVDDLEGREGKRSRTSTRERRSTNTSDQLPAPSPEPSASLQPPQHPSEPSRRSREPSSSSSNRHSSSSRTINNQPLPSSSSRQPPAPPIVVEEGIDTAATSDVLRWRSQMDAEPVSGLEAESEDRELQAKEGRRREESSTRESGPSSSRSRTTTASSRDHPLTTEPSSSTSYSSRSRNHPSSSTTTTHAALPLSFDLSHRPAPPTRQPHNSFSHSTVITTSLMKSTSSNSLNRSTSSSSSTTSYSHLARQSAKDDFYERRKRDSYVGPVGLTDLADSPPVSPPRAVRPKVEQKKREGATMAGRVEKPSRRHKSPVSPKKLPLAALSSLIPSTSLPSSTTNAEALSSSTPALPSTPVSSVRDFFTRYIMGAQQAKKPSASVDPPTVLDAEPELAEDHVPGSFVKGAEPSTSPLPIPPTSIVHPPTPPRLRPTTHAPKPSAFPSSSRPTTTAVRRPLQQTTIRSSNLPPVVPLGPPTIVPSKHKGNAKARTASNPSKPPSFSSTRANPPLASSTTTSRGLSLSSSLSTSTTTTQPKPFNLHTTTTRPVPLPQSTPLPHEPGFIPSFSHSHALEAKRAAQRLARTEALKAAKLAEEAELKKKEEGGGGRGGLFGGLERRMVERGRWEEEQRLKEVRMEVVRRREEGERMERERLKIIEERKATVIKANPVPAMYRRN